MDEKIFNQEIAKLGIKFNKIIKEEHLPVLYEDLEFIPDEAFPEICSQAVERWELWPRNFVKAIKFIWFDWNKGRKAHIDFQDCHFCQQGGVLDYTYWDTDFKRELSAVCFCGHCNNYLRHVTQLTFIHPETRRQCKSFRMTIQEIQENGWKWDQPPKPCSREEAVAAMDKMFKSLNDKARRSGLPIYQQQEFDAGRPTRQQSLDLEKARDPDPGEVPF